MLIKQFRSFHKYLGNHFFAVTICVIFVGVGLRMGAASFHSSLPDYTSEPYTDEIHYRELARNLIDYRVYAAYSQGFFSTSTRPPVYPALLSLFSVLTDSCPRAHQILNLVFESFNLILILILGTLLFGRSCGLISMTVYAFFGPIFRYLHISTAEIPAITLILSALAQLITYRRSKSYLVGLGFAVIYALLIHIRPVFLLLIPILPVLTFIPVSDRDSPGQKAIRCAFPVLLILILCLPWGIRNYRQHNTVVPVCTLAGWHIGAHARSLDDLPVDLMWRYIYDPSRRGFSEGDYYREATSGSLKLMLSEPVESTVAGIARIFYIWGFDQPYKRIFQPKAYVYPQNFGSQYFLPLIDFEGIFYVTVILAAVVFARRRRKFARRAREWWGRSWPVWVFVITYAFAHIVSIPMTQYRLMIEPVVIILFVGLLLYLCSYKLPAAESDTAELRVCHYNQAIIYLFCGGFILFSIFRFGQSAPDTLSYRSGKKSDINGINAPLRFEEIKDLQWRYYGNIPGSPRTRVAGTVRYIATGLRFPNHQISAEDADGAVAKLFVQKGSLSHPLGVGDLKLNFPRTPDEISEGDRVLVTGAVSVDPYKELIIEVEDYQIIP